MDAFEACVNEGYGWYLPSIEELKEVAASLPSGSYWSSTETSNDTACALSNMTELSVSKRTLYGVVAIRKYRNGNDDDNNGTVYKQSGDVTCKFKLLPGKYEYGAVRKSNFEKFLRFTEKSVLSGIHLFKNMLFFHDRNVNEPYKINIKRALNLNHYESENEIKVAKRPPDMPQITARSAQGASENFRNGNFQFALRYEYEDGEMSAISPYSITPFNLIPRNADDLKDFTSVNMIKVDKRNGKKVLVKVYSKDGINFTSRDIVLKSNMDGKPIDIFQDSTICTCVAARDKDIIAGATGSRGFVLMENENYYLTNKASGWFTGACINHDGSNILYAAVGDGYVVVYHLDTSGNYPVLNRVKGIEGGEYDEYQNHTVSSGFMLHMLCCNYDGNLCYVATKHSVWVSRDGGKTEVGWTMLCRYDDIFKNTADNEWKGIVHVCCSSDGNIIHAASFHRIGSSRDGGKTWTSYHTGSEYYYRINSLCCSADGKRVMAASGYNVLVSNNYGRDFTKATGLPDGRPGYTDDMMYGIGCSDSGDWMFAGRGGYDAWEESYRPLYKSTNGGVSFSPFYSLNSLYPSDVPFSVKKNIYEDLADTYVTNRTTEVSIRYNTGSRHVKAVHLLMKNGANMYKIHKVEKKGMPDNSMQEYVFSNQGSYAQVATKDVIKLYDNVPLKCRTSKVIQNALMFGGYTDGRNSDINADANVEILNESGARGDFSLKCNTMQSYGIIYYDHFGRCGAVQPVGDVYAEKITSYPDDVKRVAQLTIRHSAPAWAIKYKVARRSMTVRFDGVDGFDGAYVYKGKIYLDVTGYTHIVASAGDMLELIHEPKAVQPDHLGAELPVIGYEDILLSENSESATLPRGRYIVVNEPGIEGYDKKDVAAGSSSFVSSFFYLVYRNKTEDNKVYQEIPYDFAIENGMHKGNVQSQSGSHAAICRLDGDGDVILLDNPMREINRLPGNNIFTTLGRPNAVSDTFKETDRIAGLCVSEPYAEDTGYNGLSSFNQALVNYKDLDDEFGEIELIDGYSTNVDVYQKERCSQVLYKKNVLTSASGERQIVQSQDLFGEQIVYAGDWGMSNFSSYAKWGNARYFVDAVKRVVLRKDGNGLIPISNYGMRNWFFSHLTEQVNVAGCFDPKHDSYFLNIADTSLNFLEQRNGWSALYELTPDHITNTLHGVYAFKNGSVYQHDVLPSCKLYGKDADVVMEFVCNDWPDVVKVFNAILLESNQIPYLTEFKTNDISTQVDGSFFEKKEGLYMTYIPMGNGEDDYVMAGVCPVQYYGNKIPLMNQDAVNVHAGDKVYVMAVKDTKPDGNKTEIGHVKEINNGFLILDRNAEIQAGSLLICADGSIVNGEPQRGRYMVVKMYFRSPLQKLLVKSVQLDLDESKM